MTRTILLADDDEDDRMLFEDVFEGLPPEKFSLKIVENGHGVIQYLNELSDDQPLPNLIILDQNMPQLSGKETLMKLKSSERFNAIPVIIYSTYNDKDFIKKCEELGVTAVVSKPDSYEGYISMINKFLDDSL